MFRNRSADSKWRDIMAKRHRKSLSLVSLSIWLHASMVTAMSTLVPDTVREIGGISLVPWTFALYDIGSILVGAASGLMVLRYRLRKPMGVAALLFAAGSIICALATMMPVVMLGRLLQGLGGGGLIAISFIGIGSLFPERLMLRVMGAVSAIWGASAFLGPLIGAFFAQQLSWRAAFWFFAMMSIMLAIWILRGITQASAPDITELKKQFPVRRMMVLSIGVVLIASGGIDISLVKTPIFVLSGIGFFIWFIRMDAVSEHNRLLPRKPIGFQSQVGAGLTMILCFTMATMVVTVYGPLIIIQLHEVSIIVAGYIVACTSVGWSIGAVLISGIPSTQDKRAIVLGMAMLSVSMIGFVFVITAGPLYLLAILALVEGGGFGVAWASILRRMLLLIDHEDRGRVSAAIPTIQRLGYAIGASWIGIVANAAGLEVDVDRQTIETVARWVFIAGLPLAFIGCLATWRFVCRRPGEGTQSTNN